VNDRAPLSGPLTWVIAWRFLRGPRSRLLGGTARSALLATALGVTAMVIAMGLMSGYREDLQSKLIRGNAAVLAYPVGNKGVRLDPRKEAALLALPGVQKIGRVAYGQGSLASPARPQGVSVVLRGINITCGCFGEGSGPVTTLTVLRDVVLVAAGVALFKLAGEPRATAQAA